MVIYNLEYSTYNKLLSFGYNIKIPKYSSEKYFTNMTGLKIIHIFA